MVERDSADRQLERLLYVLPAAAQEEGARFDELAETLGVPVERVVRDIEAVTTRLNYHPSGGADDLQIMMEPERVKVWSGGRFERPTRFSVREALALAIGLRVLAAEAGEEHREGVLALAGELEAKLAVAPASQFLPRFSLDEENAEEGGIRSVLLEATRESRRCRIRYLKPDSTEPESRVIDPYAVVHACGVWYVLASPVETEDVRAFRVDRIIAIEADKERFEVPADFDPADHVTGDSVYRADDEMTATVRYSPEIARWIEEAGADGKQSNGSVVEEVSVADPGWLVRHVLQFGSDAEVVYNDSARRLVRESIARHTAERTRRRNHSG